MRNVGSAPASMSAAAAIELVVVLPWVPATATVSRSPANSASMRARGHTGMPRR